MSTLSGQPQRFVEKKSVTGVEWDNFTSFLNNAKTDVHFIQIHSADIEKESNLSTDASEIISIKEFNDNLPNREKVGICISNSSTENFFVSSVELKELLWHVSGDQFSTTNVYSMPILDDNCHFREWANLENKTISFGDKATLYLARITGEQIAFLLEKQELLIGNELNYISGKDYNIADTHFVVIFEVRGTIKDKSFSRMYEMCIQYNNMIRFSSSEKIEETHREVFIEAKEVCIYGKNKV